MAGSSCKREKLTRNAYERAIVGIGFSKRFRALGDNVQKPEHFDRSEKDMGQEATDAMVIRICQEDYVEAQQSVQCVSDGHWSRSFEASSCDSSECSNHSSEEDL